MTNLNSLRDQALRIARDHGFKDATVLEDFALIHSEVSEALEDYREGASPNKVWYEEKPAIKGTFASILHDEQGEPGRDGKLPYKFCGIPSEMADVIIRVLHFCGKHEIDIEAAVAEKMAYNDSRPYKHGGKKL